MPSEKRTAVRILVVDDDRNVAAAIRNLLVDAGFEVDVAYSVEQAGDMISCGLYDGALIDLALPDGSGLDVLRCCREADPAIATLILTSYGSLETKARAQGLGAKDFLAKPAGRDVLLPAIDRALHSTRLARQLRTLRREAGLTTAFDEIIGHSPALVEALALAKKAAAGDIAVVIEGETGTGKDLVARAIHAASARKEGLLVTAHLAAMPDEMQKGELFGYVKGAFTGAEFTHCGLFKEAEGGTLFFDEIAEVLPATQAALLRALENRMIRPLGAGHEVAVDLRVISASHRDLRSEVEEGRFREDLFYRLAGMFVTLPPLRSRREDIPTLVVHLARRCAGRQGPVPEFTPAAMDQLLEYAWPGNVRELKNVVERAMILAGGDKTIGPELCQIQPSRSASGGNTEDLADLPLKEAQRRFTARYLTDLLDRHGGDLREVAAAADVDITSVRRLVRQLGLSSKRVEQRR
jgi:DNA-binding NtrC family response regulator